MKIVCYAFEDQKKELESPFLEYLKKYKIKEEDSVKVKNKKLKQVENIEARLKHIVDNKGKYDLPPLVEKYKNREIGILKIKEGKTLIRIAFFTVINDKIILLDAFEKPSLYEKNQKKKIDRMIERFLDKAEIYKQDYLKNKISIPLNL